jgi:glycosyltransferase involved in cell wall biosynthesis
MRAGTLARRLAHRGHDVVWWTSTFDHSRKRHHCDEDSVVAWKGVTIRLLKSVGYRRNTSLRRFVEHAWVARKFRLQAGGQRPPDVILVSFPTIELARDAVRFGRTHRIPVLVDVRDLWPDIFIDVLPPPLRPFGHLLVTPFERDATFALSNCTGIIGISDGYLSWALRRANRERTHNDAIVPLGYLVQPSSDADLQAAERRLLDAGIDPSRKLCWYIGSFGRQYDLSPVLEAAACLRRAGRSDLQFVISGEGEFGERWRRMAAGTDNVVFTGWLGVDEINWLRARAAIGLQPYAQGAPQGLANKLFEYLSAGIPVVSSLQGENERLVEEWKCGVTYRAGDAVDCLHKIQALADDDVLRRAMGERGKELFAERFDTNVILDRLAAHVETVAARHPRQAIPA